jgi:membrane protein required for colicin V production
MVFLASFALLFLISALIFILAGKVLHRVMEITLLTWFDRFLGLLLGAVKGAVVSIFVFMILASSLSASNDLFNKSLSSPYLSRGAEVVRKIIHDPKIREQFVPKEPAIKLDAVPGAVTRMINEQQKQQDQEKQEAAK